MYARSFLLSPTVVVRYGPSCPVCTGRVVRCGPSCSRAELSTGRLVWESLLLRTKYYSIFRQHLYESYKSIIRQTTQTTSQKSSIKQRLRADLGRSVGVTTATQLLWLHVTGLRAHLPTPRNSRVIKRTHRPCVSKSHVRFG